MFTTATAGSTGRKHTRHPHLRHIQAIKLARETPSRSPRERHALALPWPVWTRRLRSRMRCGPSLKDSTVSDTLDHVNVTRSRDMVPCHACLSMPYRSSTTVQSTRQVGLK